MYGTGRTLAALVAALGLTLSLAACNGGSDHPRLDLRAQKLIGGSAAQDTALRQNARLVDNIMARADHISVSQVVGESQAEALPTFTFQSSFSPFCANAECKPRHLFSPLPLAGSISETVLTDGLGAVRKKEKDGDEELEILEWAAGETLGDIGRDASNIGDRATFVTKDGVTLFRQTRPDTVLGSVLDHSAFASFVKTGKVGGAHIPGNVGGFVGYTARYGVAGGDLAGSRPVQATWKGVMVGHAHAESVRGDELLGASTLTYDTGANSVDVSFTGIKNLTKERAHSVESITASGLPVSQTGGFNGLANAGYTEINGAFYGPAHAETAGTIYHRGDDAFTGAFGAKRQ